MKLDQDIFFSALNEGREIEFCFCGNWYFLRASKIKGVTTYLFTKISGPQFDETFLFESIQELLSLKIQNLVLLDALSKLDDYTIF